MKTAAVWNVLWLGLLASGCQTVYPDVSPDPVVESLAQEGEKHLGNPLSTDVITREIPLGTSINAARTIMEEHGFSCWSRVPDSKGMCLHCTAYKHTPYARKILVKIFYDERERVTGVEAVVDYDAFRIFHGG